MQTAIKLVDKTDDYLVVEGLGVPYRGPDNGKDLDGEFFDEETDFLLDDYTDRPLRYQHGRDSLIKYDKIGTVKEITRQERGLWVQSQIDRRNQYADMLEELLGKNVLGYSSGAQDSAAKIDPATGHIERWPIVEMTLTPTPANPYAVIFAKTLRTSLRDLAQYEKNRTPEERPFTHGEVKGDGHWGRLWIAQQKLHLRSV